MKQLDSAIVWQGVSALDGTTQIVAIVTGLDASSTNPKTSTMAQLYILLAETSPLTAIKSGQDSAICGSCGLRGDGHGKERGCYVVVVQGPRAVYAKYARGGYQTLAPETVADHLRTRGLRLRLGAYGDPAALPLDVLRKLTTGIVAHTGYTHAWRNRADLAPYVMASADSAADVALAQSMGFRTFRTRAEEQPLLIGEIACPASAEAGHRSTCNDCSLCDGSHGIDARKSIAIIAHGTPAVHALAYIRKVA